MIQNGDFVKINYTGKMMDGTVFDTTIESVAKTAGIDDAKSKPIIICVGQGMLVTGLDSALIGRPMGKFSTTIPPEHAFGKKDAKLLRIIPLVQLHQQKINPFPGLQLNIDGTYGIVRSVSSGRTVVDFNHPLAGQEITYDVDILGIIEDTTEQVQALLDAAKIPYTAVQIAESNATVILKQLLPQQILDLLNNRITMLTSVKTVSFETGQRPAKDAAGHEHAAKE